MLLFSLGKTVVDFLVEFFGADLGEDGGVAGFVYFEGGATVGAFDFVHDDSPFLNSLLYYMIF